MLWLGLWLMLLLIVHLTVTSGVSNINFSVPAVIVEARNDTVKTFVWRRHLRCFHMRISCFIDDRYLRRMLSRYDNGVLRTRSSVSEGDGAVRSLDCLWLIHINIAVVCWRPSTFNKIHYRPSLFSFSFLRDNFTWLLHTDKHVLSASENGRADLSSLLNHR